MTAVCKDLNAFFRQRQGDAREVVVLAPMAGPDGAFPADTNNRIIFTLANVLQETTTRNQAGPRGVPMFGMPIPVNLHVGFVANFTDYVTGLEFISDVIAFLQAKSVFD